MLTALTSYASIRAILGLSERELPDALLAVEIYDLVLVEEVTELGDTMYDDYTTASGLSTALAVNFVRALRIFASHCVAFKCAGALPLTATKAIVEGKAGLYRDGNSPYRLAMDKIEAAYKATKRQLQEAYAAYTETSIAAEAPLPLMGVSILGTDPVTGS